MRLMCPPYERSQAVCWSVSGGRMTKHEEFLTDHPQGRGVGIDHQLRGMIVSSKPMRARRINSNSRSRNSALVWLALFLAALFAPHVTFAQVDQGAITGVVTD